MNKSQRVNCHFLPGGSGQCTFPVTAADYLDVLGDQALLSMTVLTFVQETKQSGVTKLPYRLKRPELTITVDGKKG